MQNAAICLLPRALYFYPGDESLPRIRRHNEIVATERKATVPECPLSINLYVTSPKDYFRTEVTLPCHGMLLYHSPLVVRRVPNNITNTNRPSFTHTST